MRDRAVHSTLRTVEADLEQIKRGRGIDGKTQTQSRAVENNSLQLFCLDRAVHSTLRTVEADLEQIKRGRGIDGKAQTQSRAVENNSLQ
jgi:hypothetical protein